MELQSSGKSVEAKTNETITSLSETVTSLQSELRTCEINLQSQQTKLEAALKDASDANAREQ